jgi:hypothetical protein
MAIGGRNLLPRQKAVVLQQWRHARGGWQLAAWQLPPLETAVGCRLPLLQKSVVFLFLFLFFIFGFLVLGFFVFFSIL